MGVGGGKRSRIGCYRANFQSSCSRTEGSRRGRTPPLPIFNSLPMLYVDMQALALLLNMRNMNNWVIYEQCVWCGRRLGG